MRMFVIASRRSAGRVPRMLRSVISAFTRVFDALCGALLIRGPWPQDASVGPGSAEQREARCTAPGTRNLLRRRGRHPAVDHDGLAGHEGRGIGGEIGHGACDLVGLADASQ